jgi:hypothetical protein
VVRFILISLVVFSTLPVAVAQTDDLSSQAKEAAQRIADKLTIDLTTPPPPGGYMAGLTKPLMIDITTQIWGPGIKTPAPGGEYFSVRRKPGGALPIDDPQAADGPDKPASPDAGLNWDAMFAANKKVWVDKTGKFKIDAVFGKLTPGGVILVKADQSPIVVPLDKLSAESLRQAVQMSQEKQK